MIKIIDKIEFLEDLKNDWERLLSQSSYCTPFQSLEYIKSSWECMKTGNCSLFIMLYTRQKENEWQAIFPFYIDETRTLRFINDHHTDFCDAIIGVSIESDYHFWNDITKYIILNKEIRHIALKNTRIGSPILSYFKYFFYASMVYSDNAYTVAQIDKASSNDKFISSLRWLNSIDRNRLSKIYKKMGGVTTAICRYPHIYPEKEIDFLLNYMVKSGIRESEYLSELIELIKKLYQNGLLIVTVTKKENEVIAANLLLSQYNHNEYFSWLVFYKDKRYNIWSLLDNIKIISERGGILNLCRGTYEYKIRNLRPQIYSFYTLRWSRSLWGQMMDVWDMCFYQFKQIAKKIIRG